MVVQVGAASRPVISRLMSLVSGVVWIALVGAVIGVRALLHDSRGGLAANVVKIYKPWLGVFCGSHYPTCHKNLGDLCLVSSTHLSSTANLYYMRVS